MRERRKCPHAEIQHCPLYHAMHVANAPSCFSERMEEHGCKVDQGASYGHLLAELDRFDIRIAAECKWLIPRPVETMH